MRNRANFPWVPGETAPLNILFLLKNPWKIPRVRGVSRGVVSKK